MQMLAGVLALALSAAACGGDGEDATDLASTTTVESNPITGPPDGDQPTRGGVVSWGLEAEPDSMNSAFGQWASSGHFVASAVFDPIATIDENGEAVPYLAESLTPNDDFTEWTIALREGITFHDGTPVDADALLANLEAYRQSPITADALAPVTQLDRIDDRTVRLTADQRWATFPWIMTLQTGYVMAPAMVTDGSKSRSPIGSGPFVFKEWIDGESVTLERNPDYWRTDDQGEALPYLDGMAFAFIPDEPERLNQLTRGDLDAIIGYKADTILGLREAGDRFKVVENSAGEEDVLTLNTAFPPFDNINARLAVIHATDSAAVRDDVNKGVPGEATSPFAPGQLGYADDNGYPAYDPDLAREYLETYKQETGDDVLDFVYLNYGSTDDQAEAQLRRVPGPGDAHPEHRVRRLPGRRLAQLVVARPGRRLHVVALELDQAGPAVRGPLRCVAQRGPLRRPRDRPPARRGPRQRGPGAARRELPAGGPAHQRGRGLHLHAARRVGRRREPPGERHLRRRERHRTDHRQQDLACRAVGRRCRMTGRFPRSSS
jgi:ABC-type transport system substrate-binding protein